MKYDYLIVGSGLFGSVFAHCANRQGKRCLVIDKRPNLGGNLYCEQVPDSLEFLKSHFQTLLYDTPTYHIYNHNIHQFYR